MRKIIFTAILLFSSNLNSWNGLEQYQKKATREETETRISNYLQKSPTIQDHYKITNDSLMLFASLEDKQQKDPEYVIRFAGEKNPPAPNFTITQDSGKPLEGLRVAIDPVGIGGGMATIERRLIRIAPSEKTENESIELDTSALNLLTASHLKTKLEKLGAEVLLTHDSIGQAAYEKDFDAWLQEFLENNGASEESDSRLLTTLSLLLERPEILLAKIKEFVWNVLSNPEITIKKTLYYSVFNKFDITARINKINDFKPHLTLVILYNNSSQKNSNGMSLGTDQNHSLAFVPGGFLKGDLSRKEWRKDFARLALTNNLEDSIDLARHIQGRIQKQLSITPENEDAIENLAINIQKGIYCRNLALTRSVHSPVCYSLPLCIDNFDECKIMANQEERDRKIDLVAQAYVDAIIDYCARIL
ncbi:N-acetylmuramoyl-L-alanine amidase [Candidatus Babeliales bacterium]|nr:N-acetylmuramoyl-L-alanine amidase [Candidatus Babeliales bacterium]